MVATPVERSLVLVKPDGVRRALIGEIIRRIEAKGIRVVALDFRALPRELVEEHYAEHEGKPFFEPLVSFMTSGPVVSMIIEGHRCIEAFRLLAGATDPVKAAPGTIRGDLATDIGTTVVQNLVHGSDSPVSAEREIKLFFPQES
ncbi:nucleoside-diphosphate kinase [Actinocrinis puniceicyclus]|uniref:Nucleoside diphosphate kinase n=1 Tax=Actinocrinis puniceicyclus TaxID=977794 RepID=A0A8J7WKX6_9ACTN|nr:nucleoside-diphosphate kinase [Actinocrinis puniceicyclus]